jgi:hypothetical protein
MANPTSPILAFAELAPHALHLVVVSGRKIIAWGAFKPESKAEIAAFVAEHKLAGLVRASILGDRLYMHRSTESETAAVRQPVALQSHILKIAHGFTGTPGAEVCDTVSGLSPDAARVSPWLMTVFDAAAVASLSESLGEIGLAPANVTLAAPAHIGAVIGSLSGKEMALVVVPGVDEAWLAWVSAEGVQSVASVPIGFTQIFEAVQKGLGLKFRAAAGKLFFNDTYDFSEASTSICAQLGTALRPMIESKPVSFLHIAGLAAGQAWFAQGLASALGISCMKASGTSVSARVGLDASGTEIPFSAAALLHVAAAGSSSAPWVQPSVDALVAQTQTKQKTAVPFAPSPSPSPVVEPEKASAAAPNKPAAAKPAAPAVVIKPAAAPKPAPKPAAKPAPKAISAPVAEAPVAETPANAPDAAKGNKTPVFIAVGVLVAAAVGIGLYMRSPSTTSNVTPPPVPVQQPTPEPVVAAPTPTPAPPAPPATTPTPAPAVTDLFAADEHKFGNTNYRLEFSEKGFIQALSTARDDILVESIGGMSLQGSYVGTDGRRKWFNVGGVDDVGYIATVHKAVRDGNTVFDVVVQHPRFSLEQTFVCLPDSIKVVAKFKPINLRDPRGAIAAAHSVRLAPVALNPSLHMRATDNGFSYTLKQTVLRVQFDNTVWSRDGAGGMQSVIAGENGVVFHFTENTDTARNTLNYEIQLSAGS